MSNRRNFLKKSALFGGGLLISRLVKSEMTIPNLPSKSKETIFLSTWNHGVPANKKAYEVIESGGSLLDALEKAANVSESNPKNTSVGLGGMPDRDGHVTLDAAMMDGKGNAGCVCFLEGFENPISIARKVMEETPHVILAGEGAAQFARSQGFKEIDLLTPETKKAWEEWSKEARYSPEVNVENHDTIGLVGLHKGEVAATCTTSGLAFKMRGRVGDSPILGAGLFADEEVGACSATGLGEYVLKSQTSFLVLELMRQGKTAEQACKLALERIKTKFLDPNPELEFQVGLVVIGINGDFAGYSILPDYQYALTKNGKTDLIDAPFIMEKRR